MSGSNMKVSRGDEKVRWSKFRHLKGQPTSLFGYWHQTCRFAFKVLYSIFFFLIYLGHMFVILFLSRGIKILRPYNRPAG